MSRRGPRVVEIGARVLGLGDGAGAGVHVPDRIRDAGGPRYDPPLAAEGISGIRATSLLIDDQQPPTDEDGDQPLHVYGQAAGHLVALIEDARGPEGLALKVVVGPAGGNTVDAVAFFVATDEGRIDADTAANAILRAVVEGDRSPG